MIFDPTLHLKGAYPGFGEHVLLVQKSLKKLLGTHFEPMVQRHTNTTPWWGSSTAGLLINKKKTAIYLEYYDRYFRGNMMSSIVQISFGKKIPSISQGLCDYRSSGSTKSRFSDRSNIHRK